MHILSGSQVDCFLKYDKNESEGQAYFKVLSPNHNMVKLRVQPMFVHPIGSLLDVGMLVELGGVLMQM